MKDYDYVVECKERPRSNFMITGERVVDRGILDRVTRQVFGGPSQLGSLRMVSPNGPLEDSRQRMPIEGTRAMSRKRIQDRFALAIVGAVALLGSI